LGNYSSAIQDYDRALDLEPDYANVYIGRGIAYANLEDYPRAIQDYDRAISLNPDEPAAYYNRCYAFLLIKDLQRAQTDFSFYSRLNPTDINAAWMTQWLGMGKTRPTIEAIERLEEIEQVDPESYVAYVCQGLVLGLRGKLKEGLAKLEQALSLDSEAWDAYFWQGMLLAQYYKGRYEKARNALDKALELEMPPVLLTPLYWLEKERSDFFEQYARPLLEYYQV